VLQVTIHDHNNVTNTRLNAGIHRCALTTVARKKDTTKRRKSLAQITNQRLGLIG
jgi:hypothetical protein